MIIPLRLPSGFAQLGLFVDATVCLCHEPRQFDELVAVRSLDVPYLIESTILHIPQLWAHAS